MMRPFGYAGAPIRTGDLVALDERGLLVPFSDAPGPKFYVPGDGTDNLITAPPPPLHPTEDGIKAMAAAREEAARCPHKIRRREGVELRCEGTIEHKGPHQNGYTAWLTPMEVPPDAIVIGDGSTLYGTCNTLVQTVAGVDLHCGLQAGHPGECVGPKTGTFADGSPWAQTVPDAAERRDGERCQETADILNKPTRCDLTWGHRGDHKAGAVQWRGRLLVQEQRIQQQDEKLRKLEEQVRAMQGHAKKQADQHRANQHLNAALRDANRDLERERHRANVLAARLLLLQGEEGMRHG